MAGPRETRYLSLADVIALHEFVMQQLGAAPGLLRDEGLLESAVMRPQMAAYYGEADTVRQCALLAAGIVKAHAFVDGNKRTAFAAIRAFLGLNGLHYPGEPMQLATQLEAVAASPGSADEATQQLESWLRARVEPSP